MLFRSTRAKAALSKINTFIKSKTNSNPASVSSGYALNGTQLHNYVDLPFLAPFAVSAMIDETNQQWLNDLWSSIVATQLNDDSYYGNTLKMLSMITVSGNWWNIKSDTFYVATNGNDNNSGTQLSPWKTIQHSCNVATPGSTVLIKSGTYNEKITMNVSGNVDASFITFKNFSNDTVTIDGTGIVGDQIILVQDKNYIKLIGLELQNNLHQTFGTGIWIQGGGNHIEIRNCRIHDMRATSSGDAMAISVYGTNGSISLSNIVIDSNIIYKCQPGHSEALTLNGNVDTFQISHNIVHDVNNIGIDMIGGEGTSPISNTDMVRNGICVGNIVYNARSNYGGGYAAGIYVDGGKSIGAGI